MYQRDSGWPVEIRLEAVPAIVPAKISFAGTFQLWLSPILATV